MSANGMIYYSTKRATVGLIVEDGIVIDAPPYARKWTIGRYALELWNDLLNRPERVQLSWIPNERT